MRCVGVPKQIQSAGTVRELLASWACEIPILCWQLPLQMALLVARHGLDVLFHPNPSFLGRNQVGPSVVNLDLFGCVFGKRAGASETHEQLNIAEDTAAVSVFDKAHAETLAEHLCAWAPLTLSDGDELRRQQLCQGVGWLRNFARQAHHRHKEHSNHIIPAVKLLHCLFSSYKLRQDTKLRDVIHRILHITFPEQVDAEHVVKELKSARLPSAALFSLRRLTRDIAYTFVSRDTEVKRGIIEAPNVITLDSSPFHGQDWQKMSYTDCPGEKLEDLCGAVWQLARTKMQSRPNVCVHISPFQI